MEETSQETKKVNWQNFPTEILCEIFKNLNVKDLSNVAAVNKLWNEEVKRERMKRGLEKIVLSVTNGNVYESMRVKPYVTFMFLASEVTEDSTTEDLQICAIEKYKDYFPHYLVGVGSDYVIMDQELVTVKLDTIDEDDFYTCHDEMSAGDIVTLLIPEYQDLQIRAAYNQKLDNLKHDEFLNEFLPEDSQSKATFIVLADNNFDNQHLFGFLKKSMVERKQKYSVWGASFDSAPFAAVNGEAKRTIEFIPCRGPAMIMKGRNGMFAMSITGSSLESWSIVISCITRKQEFDKKLSDFRDQLQLKRRSIGLVCGSHEVVDNSGADSSNVHMTFPEMLHVVKGIFPGVPFIGMYDKTRENLYYGLKSQIDDPDQQLQHEMSLSLMILTYD